MNRLPVLKGTLDILVLRALSWTPMHGFEIVTWLERAAKDALDIEDSALYQAVYRLEERGLVAASWGVTENNRKAKFYKLTRKGRVTADAEHNSWLRLSKAVTRVLRGLEQGA